VRLILAVVVALLLSGCWTLTVRVPVPWGGNAEVVADFRERHEANQEPPRTNEAAAEEEIDGR
jgi:hypothetical protein